MVVSSPRPYSPGWRLSIGDNLQSISANPENLGDKTSPMVSMAIASLQVEPALVLTQVSWLGTSVVVLVSRSQTAFSYIFTGRNCPIIKEEKAVWVREI